MVDLHYAPSDLDPTLAVASAIGEVGLRGAVARGITGEATDIARRSNLAVELFGYTNDEEIEIATTALEEYPAEGRVEVWPGPLNVIYNDQDIVRRSVALARRGWRRLAHALFGAVGGPSHVPRGVRYPAGRVAIRGRSAGGGAAEPSRGLDRAGRPPRSPHPVAAIGQKTAGRLRSYAAVARQEVGELRAVHRWPWLALDRWLRNSPLARRSTTNSHVTVSEHRPNGGPPLLLVLLAGCGGRVAGR